MYDRECYYNWVWSITRNIRCWNKVMGNFAIFCHARNLCIGRPQVASGDCEMWIAPPSCDSDYICVCICICICISIYIRNCIWERETRGPPLPPPCDRGPNPISPIITTVHHDSARRLNPYGRILPMMQSAQDQRVLHNDQKPSWKLQEYILMSWGRIFPWPMAFQLSAKFLLAIVNSIGKMQMHHTKQVATSVYIMSASVIRE